ncbi:hypothetical protein GLYMA_12G141100v4 [Glycine max]|nr:hypothetical protein GLYMA_12G141100v4 [Glycine max]KAH1143108.1 hypothetical protein GYH30_033695 [Glycine max]
MTLCKPVRNESGCQKLAGKKKKKKNCAVRWRVVLETSRGVWKRALQRQGLALTGSILDADIHHNILSLLKSKAKGHQSPNLISEKLSASLYGHTKAVNAIHWSSTHAHLLASAGMDHAVCIWNVWGRNQKKACVLNFHNAAVKDVKWSQQGHFLLSCGYDCTSRLIDVEKGLETRVFREDQIVGVIKFHPDNSNPTKHGHPIPLSCPGVRHVSVSVSNTTPTLTSKSASH